MAVPQRIVSLLPSSTEILCALGLETSLVGISHACDFPPQVAPLPRLTAPSRNTSEAGRGPDLEVHALVRAGLHAYRLDLDLLRTLRPDLIVTQDQAGSLRRFRWRCAGGHTSRLGSAHRSAIAPSHLAPGYLGRHLSSGGSHSSRSGRLRRSSKDSSHASTRSWQRASCCVRRHALQCCPGPIRSSSPGTGSQT